MFRFVGSDIMNVQQCAIFNTMHRILITSSLQYCPPDYGMWAKLDHRKILFTPRNLENLLSQIKLQDFAKNVFYLRQVLEEFGNECFIVGMDR